MAAHRHTDTCQQRGSLQSSLSELSISTDVSTLLVRDRDPPPAGLLWASTGDRRRAPPVPEATEPGLRAMGEEAGFGDTGPGEVGDRRGK